MFLLTARGLIRSTLTGCQGLTRSTLPMNETSRLHGRSLYIVQCPEAIVAGEKWKRLLLEPPLSDTVVAVAVDEAHGVYIQVVSEFVLLSL